MANIFITGISRGLGLEITKLAIGRGHYIFGICRSISQELGELRLTHPDQVHILQYDLNNHKDIRQKIFKEFIGETPLHSFINNAAKAYDTLLTNMDADEVIALTMVNQIVPMLLTKCVIRNMLLHEVQGSIVHISSVSAHTGYKGLSMYAASKGALESFSKTTAREWGSKGIRSNCIAAGFMHTEMTASLDTDLKNKIFNRTSLKQVTSEHSVAATALFLLSEDASSITGQVIHVDSGTL